MSKEPTVWKAQWPLSGEPFALIYDADTRELQSLVPATTKLFKKLFQEKYVRVFFEGAVNGDGTVTVNKLVRLEQWIDLPLHHVLPNDAPVKPLENVEVISRAALSHKEN